MKTHLIALFSAVFSIFLPFMAYSFTTSGFVDPYGVVVDGKTGYIYVSNMNGAPDVKDDNGFISRLKSDGTVENLRFIDGTHPNIVLNSPKGMVIMGNFLYVCDIDSLQVFNVETGMRLFEVNFGDLPRQNFYDIIAGPDGALYIADAGINRIYRIDLSKQHEVTLFISGEELGGPRGLAWYTPKQSFIVTGGDSGRVTAYDKSGKPLDMPSIFLKAPQGIDADDNGNLYVADQKLKAVYRLPSNFALYSYTQGVEGPAGVAYNRGTKSLIVAAFGGNSVQSYSVGP